MNTKKIKTGKRFKREIVSILITCTKKDVFLGKRLMLMQMNKDGNIGFPNSNVKDNENLQEALERMLFENLNLKKETFMLNPFCSHLIAPKSKNKKIASHLFNISVTEEQMLEIIKNSVSSNDFITNSRGNFLMDVRANSKKYNNKLLRRSNLLRAVREELELIIPYFGSH